MRSLMLPVSAVPIALALGTAVPGCRQNETKTEIRRDEEKVQLPPHPTFFIELASLSLDGNPGNKGSSRPSLSADGQIVAFESSADNLVPGDLNGFSDIFVRNRASRKTELVSIGIRGKSADGDSYALSLSADGKFVAFISLASNLVPNDTNGASNVFIRDRVTGTTELISIGLGGRPPNGNCQPYIALNVDGRFVAFSSNASNLVPGDTNRMEDVFLRDRIKGSTELISVGLGGKSANGRSFNPSLSADGRFVVFNSLASNLVTGDTNGDADIFVRDRVTKLTRRISVGPGGVESNTGSWMPMPGRDGQTTVFFQSEGSGERNNFFAFDLKTGLTQTLSEDPNFPDTCFGEAISGGPDGRFVACPSEQMLVYDRRRASLKNVSINAKGSEAIFSGQSPKRGPHGLIPLRSKFPAISANGAFLAFSSSATNLVPVKVDAATEANVQIYIVGLNYFFPD